MFSPTLGISPSLVHCKNVRCIRIASKTTDSICFNVMDKTVGLNNLEGMAMIHLFKFSSQLTLQLLLTHHLFLLSGIRLQYPKTTLNSLFTKYAFTTP